MDNYYSSYYLAHHGIKGMKWGIRRYQNEDGTLTDAGKRRYGESTARQVQRDLNDADQYETKHRVNYAERTRKADRYGEKAQKAEAKGNSRRSERFLKKQEKQSQKAQREKDQIKAYEKYKREITNTIVNRGYDVTTTTMSRKNVRAGEMYLSAALAGFAGMGVYALMSNRADGKQYKVYGESSTTRKERPVNYLDDER